MISIALVQFTDIGNTFVKKMLPNEMSILEL